MIVLFFSMVGSFALLLDRPSPGQPTNDNLRAGHVYIIYSGFLVAPPYSGGGGGHARGAGGLFRRQKKRVPEKNIGGSGGRRPVFEGVLKEKQSKNRQEGVKKTQLSRRPASNGTIGNRGEPSIEGIRSGQPVFNRNP